MNSALLWAFIAICAAGCTPPPDKAVPVSSAALDPSAVPTTDGVADMDASVDAGDDDDGASTVLPPWFRIPPRVSPLDVPDETRSPLPKPGDWADKTPRDVVVRPPYTCALQRVREWNRINCDAQNATVTLVTGTREGVSLWANPDRAQIMFAVRRGDRRVIELVPHDKQVMVEGNYGPSMDVQPGGGPTVFTETWLEGEDAPTLVVQ